MRHAKKRQRFSRPRAQRKALIRSLARSLLIYERITTSESKAKALRRWMDNLISLAKDNSLHSMRIAYNFLQDHSLVKRLFEEVGPRFNSIKGGYTRVLDLGYRKGDGAKISLIELTKIEKKEKKRKEKVKKEKEIQASEEKKEEKRPLRKEKPKKGIIDGVKGIFKKERDSL
jgi:large subunit ribosomal protein L17